MFLSYNIYFAFTRPEMFTRLQRKWTQRNLIYCPFVAHSECLRYYKSERDIIHIIYKTQSHNTGHGVADFLKAPTYIMAIVGWVMPLWLERRPTLFASTLIIASD